MHNLQFLVLKILDKIRFTLLTSNGNFKAKKWLYAVDSIWFLKQKNEALTNHQTTNHEG